MTRWAALARRPEQRWLVGAPERVCLPANPLEPGGWVVSLGVFLTRLGLAALFGELVFRVRRSRRHHRARRARGDDWLCAACLHTEAGT
ncbi:hypothetical protein [Deinococcus aestuarii]|uniref:hypothetical protein n=1 Tax=Deinococcus aestuarii TaxID=2774531 RepID=UPI001C0D9E23|nr:hypothetical protein [Deinococcus aestuarii]